MVASLLYFGHALETTRQSVARSVYFRRRLRGAALLGAAPHPVTYCGATDTIPVSFDNIPVSGNACGQPMDSLAVHDTSCTLGSITAVVYGSDTNGPFSYYWNTGSTDSTAVPLVSDSTYSVTITDANGCYTEDTATLSFTDGIIAFLSLDSLTCSGTGNILAGDSLAVGNVMYVWSPGGDTSPGISHVSGTYTVIITDSLGCKATHSITVPNDSLIMTISGPTTNCDTGYAVYSIAVPDINASYTWTFKGADTSTATGISVLVQWTSWPDTLWVIGIDTACGLTDTTILVLDSCCVPSDSATTVYALSDITATQVTQSSGTGIVYQALPYQPISGGYEVTGATISINGTYTVNENVEFIDCKVYMGPGAVIVVDSGYTFALDTLMSGDTTLPTVLTACSAMWQGIRLQPTAVFISIDAYIQDADSAVYVHGRASITATGSFFEKNYKSIVIDDDTGSSAYPLLLNANTFSGYARLLPPYPDSVQSDVGVEVHNIKNCQVGNDTDAGRNIFFNMDTAINIINSGAMVQSSYIGINPALDTLEDDPGPANVAVGINARGNQGAGSQNGPGIQLGGNSTYSNIILCNQVGILINGFTNSPVEIANNYTAMPGDDYMDSLDGPAINISITGFQVTQDTLVTDSTPYVYIHDNSIWDGTAGIAIHNILGAARIENDTITFVGYYETPRVGIAIADTALSSFPVGDTIADNQIYSGYYGISNTYRHGQHIFENAITVTPPTSDTAVGINLLNCPLARLSCNNISGGGETATTSYGITYTGSDTGSQLLYNTLSYLGTGFMANNTTRVRLINNIFQNSTIGIGVSGLNATIGNQGNADTTYNNLWEGSFPSGMLYSFNDAEFSIVDTFFVKSASDSVLDPNSGLYAIYNPPNISIAFLTPSRQIQFKTITDTGEYNPTFPPDNCSPLPNNIQLRTPYFGNNTTPSTQDTSIPQNQQLDYKLIPNLFKDNLSAKITLGIDETGEVDIYNLDGILMGKFSVSSGINEINLNNASLTAGVYLYKVFVNGQIKTNDKLVVVH